ncbi:Pls/PosA family non-ribosomal peptide synthetase [Streptomyces sp. UNOB3_S3]|uniref:Pls/PosA family non-ribosomal peptide synthetase n=1 Tax=Streptomyces sp. UNOB3_S3 TaxID=2871682 RepID=UPI001E65395E|nr:Pls/PosA family non-ribosomal peptide synthetase [Streptomyces sp. UNOB3_S3]MCC3777386.1 amino acid adenylation domain-containing protein [Streptomyces sp. UNOB3_S3]
MAESTTATGSAGTRATGAPPDVRTLAEYFEYACDKAPHRTAVICDGRRLGYAELDRRANRLAHLLRARGAGEGSRVGILLDRSADCYTALLAVLKAGAAYVPLDPSFPADRLAFIAHDAELSDLVTASSRSGRTRDLHCPVLELDRAEELLARRPDTRPGVRPGPSSLCYVIYTSGTTGRPKGVAVSHASIVNFLRVVAPIYRVRPEDRVYQGLSLAFDFAVEEIWPTWLAGATLVAGPGDDRRAGEGLNGFLIEHGITVLCCVPTLLMTLEAEVPTLRSLLVSGEACPPGLVRRWWRPGRRILNAYGPTEATVTATCGELAPDRPVTIGTPLPTYRVYILDEKLRPVARGESGEICIGGPGVALGYVNRPELTAERFVPNPVPGDRDRAPRVYRTGDRGRFTGAGELEYLGRTDTQVKIRGYRIELAEIETVLREDRAVGNAVVTPLEREGVAQGLIGYVTLTGHAADRPSDEELRERLRVRLRNRLPGYMVPSFLEVLPEFPLLAADKVDRAALPAPVSPPLARRTQPRTAPATPLERRLTALWQDILGAGGTDSDGGGLSVEDDFFCDLGGHSMTAARLISRMRQDPAFGDVAMGDLYAHPTVRDLAAFIASARSQTPARETPAPPPLRHSTLRVAVCGIAQLMGLYLWLLLPSVAAVALLYRLFEAWRVPVRAPPAGSALDVAGHLPMPVFLLLTAGWLVLTLGVLPLFVCRLLMAGVRPGDYPLWGVTYLRFWLHGRVLATSPVALLPGSPLFAVCLRLLGARIGRGCHLSALFFPASLVEIGERTSVGYGARVQPYTVTGGRLRLGPVRIGSGCFVGANSVVLPGAVIGDGASVGEQSLVPEGQVVPAGEHWAGAPVTRRDATPPLLADMAARADDERPWPVPVLAGYAAGALLFTLVPLLSISVPPVIVAGTAWRYGFAWACAAAAVAGPVAVLGICGAVLLVKKALMRTAPAGLHIERGAFGVRKWISDGMLTQSLTLTHALYSTLYLVPFLRWLGARTGRWAEVATVSFVDPDMLVIGEQSFVADISMVGPAVFHRGRIALAPAEVGRRAFVGNGALVPGSCRIGDNALLGVHSLAPETPLAPETTWLGSPAIFLPHREASKAFDPKLTYSPTRGLIAARLAIEYFRVTLPATIGALCGLGSLYLALRVAEASRPLVLFLVAPALVLLAGLAATLVTVVIKWLVVGRYRPREEPLWSVWVRRTELVTGLFENLVVPAFLNLLTGTPWICWMLRLFGARIGRRVWLSTTYLTEFDLVEVGDDAAVGEVTSLQTHLFEDRVMKMSHVTVGASASVGVRSVVLYGARVGSGARLDSMSLVMKGESLPDGTSWRGIPARPATAPVSTTAEAAPEANAEATAGGAS